MKAIVEQGGRQYAVSEGARIAVERVAVPAGAPFRFERVLAAGEGADLKVGRPCLTDVEVEGTVEGEEKGEKTIAYRYRKRKNYHRKTGHRPVLTRIKITKVAARKDEPLSP